MKVFVTCAFLLQALLLAQAFDEKAFFETWSANMVKCGEELKIDVSDFKDRNAPNFAKLLQEEYKCLPKCILEKFGVVDASGAFSQEKFKAIVPDVPAPIAADIDQCLKEHTEADLCNRYAAVNSCFMMKLAKQ